MQTIIAMGGGGFSMESSPLLDDFILGAAAARGRARPRVLFVATASGDNENYIVRFYRALGDCADAHHLELFRRTHADLTALVAGFDAVYVGGGNTANMLAVWRLHGFDRALRAAYDDGVVLAGISAGSVCWFEGAVTDSFGPTLVPLGDGLGFLPGAMAPHYDNDAQRRPVLHRMIGDRLYPSGWAADDSAALVFRSGELAEAVSSRAGAHAYRIERDADGIVHERRIESRYLGA